MKDIITLAKEAGAHLFDNPKMRADTGIIFSDDTLGRFATLLEAEIRKEYEVKLENAASLAFRQDDDIANLTAQNAKLIEALDRLNKLIVSAAIPIEGICASSLGLHSEYTQMELIAARDSIRDWVLFHAAITPQPEEKT